MYLGKIDKYFLKFRNGTKIKIKDNYGVYKIY